MWNWEFGLHHDTCHPSGSFGTWQRGCDGARRTCRGWQALRHREQQRLRYARSACRVRHRPHRLAAEHVRLPGALGGQSAQAGNVARRQDRHRTRRRHLYSGDEARREIPRRQSNHRGRCGVLNGAHPGDEAGRLRAVQGRDRSGEDQGARRAHRAVYAQPAICGVQFDTVRTLGGEQQAAARARQVGRHGRRLAGAQRGGLGGLQAAAL